MQDQARAMQVMLSVAELRQMLSVAEAFNADGVGIGLAGAGGSHPYTVWRDSDNAETYAVTTA